MKQIKQLFVALILTVSLNGFSARECEIFSSADYAEAQEIFLKNYARVPGVTALHIAAAKGDLEGIEKALVAGIDINALDSRKFTAAHFAALREDSAAFDLLKEKGANLKLRNKWYAGAADFLKVVHLADPKLQRINFWDENAQSVTQIDGVEFCEQTGATFVDGVKLRPQTAMRIWAEETKGENASRPNLSKTNLDVASRRSPYTDFYIKKISDKYGNNLGFGLFANRDFQPGEVLSLYEGEWAFEGHNPEYQLTKIDATKLRGYLGFAADGAPNAFVVPLPDRHGVPQSSYALAIQPISKDDGIMWDYGQHDIKWEMYSELAPQKVKDYLGSINLAQWAQSDEAQAPDASVQGMANLNIFAYIANTPVVFIRLALEGIIDAEDLSVMHRLATTIGGLPQQSFNLLLRGLALVKKSPQVHKYFLDKADEGNVSILLNTMVYIGQLGKSVTMNDAQEHWDYIQDHICGLKLDESGRRGGCYLLKKFKDEL